VGRPIRRRSRRNSVDRAAPPRRPSERSPTVASGQERLTGRRAGALSVPPRRKPLQALSIRQVAWLGAKRRNRAPLTPLVASVPVPGASTVRSSRLSGWVVRDLVGSARFWASSGGASGSVLTPYTPRRFLSITDDGGGNARPAAAPATCAAGRVALAVAPHPWEGSPREAARGTPERPHAGALPTGSSSIDSVTVQFQAVGVFHDSQTIPLGSEAPYMTGGPPVREGIGCPVFVGTRRLNPPMELVTRREAKPSSPTRRRAGCCRL
jgi:hypothetical protein